MTWRDNVAVLTVFALAFIAGMVCGSTLTLPNQPTAQTDTANANRPDSTGGAESPAAQSEKPSASRNQSESDTQKTDRQREERIADATDQLAIDTHRLVWVGGIVGAGELLILIFQTIYTASNAIAAKRSLELTVRTGRARIAITHGSPGIVKEAFEGSSSAQPETRQRFRVALNIANRGRGVGTLTARSFTHAVWDGNDFTDVPDYDSALTMFVPLESGQSFPFSYVSTLLARTWKELEDPEDGDNRRLYLFGYVDYITDSDEHRRAGYGHVYEPSGRDFDRFYIHVGRRIEHADEPASDNISPIGLLSYNYDRVRLRGEGSDWEQQGQ